MEQRQDLTKGMSLVILSLATSIDAYIIGISFAILKVQIVIASFIIGITTYTLSMFGILIGKKTGTKFEKMLGIIGGALLIIIGIKILIEHLFF